MVMTKFKDYKVQKLMQEICPWKWIATLFSLFLEVIFINFVSFSVMPQGQKCESSVFQQFAYKVLS